MKSDEFETFLLNDQTDANGFSMSWGAIKSGASKWIGIPGILNEKCNDVECKFEHTGGVNLDNARHLSEDHKVSEITDIRLDEKTHTLFAIHQIKSADFLEKICNDEIQYVSQSIWLDAAPTDLGNVTVSNTAYTPIHLAFVSDPAFEKNKAKITEKPCCKNIKNLGQSSSIMENKETEQHMSSDEMIQEIHSIIKAMVTPKTETPKTETPKTETPVPEKKEEPKEKTQSSKKPRFNFNWPKSNSKESNLLEDLIR